jgi:hypothetical protein
MSRIVLHTSPKHLYRKLGVALLLLAAGAGLLALGLSRVAAWSLALLGGGWALLLVRALGEDTERLVIDDSGIRDTLLPVGPIDWSEIRAASVQTIGSVSVVALEVRDSERFIRRLPPARQFIARKAMEAGLPALYLTLVGTDGDPQAIADTINRRVGDRK